MFFLLLIKIYCSINKKWNESELESFLKCGCIFIKEKLRKCQANTVSCPVAEGVAYFVLFFHLD